MMLAFLEACGIPAEEHASWRRAWERVAGNEQVRPSLDTELSRLREEAQARADQILREARQRADALDAERIQILQQAHDEATQIHAEAKAEVQKLRDQAEEEASAILATAQQRARDLLAEIDQERVRIRPATGRDLCLLESSRLANGWEVGPCWRAGNMKPPQPGGVCLIPGISSRMVLRPPPDRAHKVSRSDQGDPCPGTAAGFTCHQ
ncbi:hypothetical protein ACQP1W_32520 [Spirillospora sp. CA-255316]